MAPRMREKLTLASKLEGQVAGHLEVGEIEPTRVFVPFPRLYAAGFVLAVHERPPIRAVGLELRHRDLAAAD